MLLICERHLHDCIISKTGEALANKTSLATKLIIESPKIVDYKDNIDTTNTHDCLLSWCFIGLSIISFVAKLVLLVIATFNNI
jgi:hypothetical protein